MVTTRQIKAKIHIRLPYHEKKQVLYTKDRESHEQDDCHARTL